MDNCRVCGTMMEDFETYESEYFGDTHYEYLRAYCPKCRKHYRWVEIFRFSGIEDFEEDE